MGPFRDWARLVTAIVATAALIASIGVALGYKTPQQSMTAESVARSQIEADVSALKEKYYIHDVRLSIVETKIDDIHGGLEELVGHKLGGAK